MNQGNISISRYKWSQDLQFSTRRGLVLHTSPAIRPGDIVPTPTRIINLMNTKAAKWSQDLHFSTRRGSVPDMQDVDVLQDVPTRLEDRSGW